MDAPSYWEVIPKDIRDCVQPFKHGTELASMRAELLAWFGGVDYTFGEFCRLMHESAGVLTGSWVFHHMLAAVDPESGAQWAPGDIDVFLPMPLLSSDMPWPTEHHDRPHKVNRFFAIERCDRHLLSRFCAQLAFTTDVRLEAAANYYTKLGHDSVLCVRTFASAYSSRPLQLVFVNASCNRAAMQSYVEQHFDFDVIRNVVSFPCRADTAPHLELHVSVPSYPRMVITITAGALLMTTFERILRFHQRGFHFAVTAECEHFMQMCHRRAPIAFQAHSPGAPPSTDKDEDGATRFIPQHRNLEGFLPHMTRVVRALTQARASCLCRQCSTLTPDHDRSGETRTTQASAENGFNPE